MNFQRGALVIVPLFLCILVGVSALTGAHAVEASEFVIAANDGYGVEDCLAEGGECGQVVADAWCEAHGRGAAIKFGPQNVLAGATKISTAGEAYIIKCSN